MSTTLRKALAVVAGSAVLFPLSACGSGSSSSSGGTVTLRYAMWDDVQKAPIQKSLDQFMKLHPNIKVTIELNAWATYWTKLQTQLAGRSAPDVFWDHVSYFPKFAQQGVLTDLTSLIKTDNVDLSQYDPKLATGWQKDGKTYGLPKDWDTIGLVYNTKAIKAAGVSAGQLNDLSWNPADGGTFVKALQQLTVDKNGKHPNEAGF